MIRTLAAASVAALLALPAAAASVSFDFTGGWGQSSAAHQFSKDGLNLTVGGWKCGNPCYTVSAQRWSSGFGILSGRGDEHYIDGKDGDEILTLAFGKAVTITSLAFSYADGNDDVSVLRLANGTVVTDASGRLTLLGNGRGSFTVSNGIVGSIFGVAARGSNDEYKLRGVTVSYDDPPVPAVPLPAAGWMLMAAIGGLAAARRRRRA